VWPFLLTVGLHRARIITFPVSQLAPIESHEQCRNMLRCNQLEDDVYGTIADFIVRRLTLHSTCRTTKFYRADSPRAPATANLLSVPLRRSSGRRDGATEVLRQVLHGKPAVTITDHYDKRAPAAADFFCSRNNNCNRQPATGYATDSCCNEFPTTL